MVGLAHEVVHSLGGRRDREVPASSGSYTPGFQLGARNRTQESPQIWIRTSMKATPSRKPTTPSATRSLMSLPSSPTGQRRARFQGYRFGCVWDG